MSEFKKISEMGFTLDRMAYNSLVELYMATGKIPKILKILQEMKGRNIMPDNSSYTMLIKAYIKQHKFAKAEEEFLKIPNPDAPMYHLMIDMYMTTENYKNAQQLLNQMTAQGIPVTDTTKRILKELHGKTREWKIPKKSSICKIY